MLKEMHSFRVVEPRLLLKEDRNTSMEACVKVEGSVASQPPGNASLRQRYLG
jgi:hypothetical protein